MSGSYTLREKKAAMGLGFRVEGSLGFRVRVQGLGFRIEGLGYSS